MKILLRSRGICDDVIASLLGEDYFIINFHWVGREGGEGRGGVFFSARIFSWLKALYEFSFIYDYYFKYSANF